MSVVLAEAVDRAVTRMLAEQNGTVERLIRCGLLARQATKEKAWLSH